MIRLIRLFLKSLGFDICAHEYSSWEDEYETGLTLRSYGILANTYAEDRNPSARKTHLRQHRRCIYCSDVKVRHIDLKRSDIRL